MRVLIAENDRALGLFLKQGLELDGHEVQWQPDGDSAAAAFLSQPPDLVVLDANLTSHDGAEMLAAIRSIDDAVPVLVLIGRQGLEDKVTCLDRGADDCMIKPLSLQELRARCRALLRRRRATNLVLRCAGVELDRVNHSVERDGKAVPLTNTEFAVLEYLMLNRGSCITRAALLAQVWDRHAHTGTKVVDVYINYLRRKLGDETPPSLIQTIRGRGYKVANDTVAARALERNHPGNGKSGLTGKARPGS